VKEKGCEAGGLRMLEIWIGRGQRLTLTAVIMFLVKGP
jgi:hypothetical protein